MTVSIEGFAIVSRDGMLAGSDGLMPNSLKFQPDLEFLDQALDAATLLIHGRKSHEAQGNSSSRRRLLLTRSAGPFSTFPVEPNVWPWNPEATPFETVRRALGVESGVVAILGGTAAYDMFLPHYARFHLSRTGRIALPGGVPVFSKLCEGRTPEEVLHANGLALVAEYTLDKACDLHQQTWARAA
jgi:hypothetical protein